MTPSTLVVSAVVAGMPIGYEVDFDVLPAAKTVPGYEYTIVIGVAGHQDIKLTTEVGTVGLDTVADAFDVSDDPAWRSKRVGNRITLYACNGYRVTKIVVTGDGPKPAVRRVWPLPENKKK